MLSEFSLNAWRSSVSTKSSGGDSLRSSVVRSLLLLVVTRVNYESLRTAERCRLAPAERGEGWGVGVSGGWRISFALRGGNFRTVLLGI
eukprot:4961150-Pyramimonas_sp.AAC.1